MMRGLILQIGRTGEILDARIIRNDVTRRLIFED